MRRFIGAIAVFAAIGWVVASYHRGGIVLSLVAASRNSDRSIEILRTYLAGWGPLGPFIYVALVVIEVLVAPIPGALLYAPGGAVFGGGVGGTLSLAGNVIGATIACLVPRLFGRRIEHLLDARGLARYRGLIVERGVWVIFLLRVNPLTSSDLVSYAAGFVGMSPWKVAAGTFAGMAPLCYAQAYLADRLLRVLPGSMWIVAALGAAYLGVVVWVLTTGARDRPPVPGQGNAPVPPSGV